MRLLGLDVGTKTVGVAVSDALGWHATSMETIRYTKSLDHVFKRIQDIIEEYSIKECVIGLPINMDGSMGKQGRFVEGFTEKLKGHIEIPCNLWDERLSTWEAQQAMISQDMKRKKRKKIIDQVAASFILQSYLDHNRTT